MPATEPNENLTPGHGERLTTEPTECLTIEFDGQLAPEPDESLARVRRKHGDRASERFAAEPDERFG